ncbi:MAG: hypothetical protein WD532_11190 [Acidimicrobiia bacterium]
MTAEGRRRHRVVASHRIATSAFRLAGVFAVVAVGWAIVVLVRGGSWWGPVHAFLLGSVTLAIAGASQMFTVTWSAAPAPRASAAAIQRWMHTVGAAAVLGGMVVRSMGGLVVGGVAVAAGLVLLAANLLSAVRRSLLRRFDLSARFYLLAIACAVVGVTLGVLLSVGVVGDRYSTVRVVHGHLNLVGFVGFTIIGTLPTILPTFAHHPAVSGGEAILAWRLAILSAGVTVSGLVLGAPAVGVGTLLAACSLVLVTAGVTVRLGRTGLRGGLAYLQVSLGCGWLAVWAVVDGTRLLSASVGPAFDGWIAAAVVAGVGQVLLGSLAYLIPVLAGPGPRLGRNFDRFQRRSWIPLVAANGTAVALLVPAPPVAGFLLAIWVLDFTRRLALMERGATDES